MRFDSSLLEHIPDDLIDTHYLLNAWAEWGRPKTKQNTCGSLEKQYRSPWRQWHYPDLYAQWTKLPDFQAIDVERAVQQLHESHRNVIRLWYIKKAPPWVLKSAANIKMSDLPNFLNESRKMVRNRLHSSLQADIKPQNLTTDHSGHRPLRGLVLSVG